MSRFAALDLNSLPAPSAIEALSFEATLEARFVELEATLTGEFEPSRVAEIMGYARNIASSPLRYLTESAAAREVFLTNRINQKVLSIFLATAAGSDLDLIGANRGVVRKTLDASHAESDADNILLEGDEFFRARIQLVVEAWSPHGTEGSYVYWALDADNRVIDVAVYGPNSDLDPPIPSAEPKMVVLSIEGDGTADADLVDKVRQNCIPDKRRPVGDKLTVISATPVPYAIEAVLHVTSQEAAAALEVAALAAAEGFVNGRIRIGRKLYRASIAAALSVQGVVDVELISPAENIAIGPFEAAHCTGISISMQTIAGGWRDV
jgi:phage-related baseplate assembly protein